MEAVIKTVGRQWLLSAFVGLACACALAGASQAADPLGAAPQARVGAVAPPASSLPANAAQSPQADVVSAVPGPDLAAMHAILAAEHRPQAGAGTLIPSGVSLLHVDLTTGDGRVFRLTEGIAGMSFMADNGYILTMGMSSLTDRRPAYQFAYRFALQDGGVSVSTVFALPQGDIVQPAAVQFPVEGGTRTVSLADGGSLTLTLDGAHTITQAELDLAAQLKAIAVADR